MLHGDSRRLVELVGEAGVVVGSPPFENQFPAHDKPENYSGFQHVGSVRNRDTGYKYAENSPGQLGSMPTGSLDSVVSSPPYAESLKGDGSQSETAEESREKRKTEGGSLGKSQRTSGYGSAENLGNLPTGEIEAVVGSPPYSGNEKSDYRVKDDQGHDRDERRGCRQGQGCFRGSENYGGSPGQLGNLPPGSVEEVSACVGSPPYEHTEGFNDRLQEVGKTTVHHGGDGRGGTLRPTARAGGIGRSPGQLGNAHGDTFWSASRDILEQLHQILKPGGICIWVTKRFVRDGAIVEFSEQWLRLCEACGFEFVEWIKASLVKEDRHPSLFGGEEVRTKARKGFFRRLHEKKRPDLAIDWEDVIVVRKP